MPPTMKNLRWLTEFDTAADVMRAGAEIVDVDAADGAVEAVDEVDELVVAAVDSDEADGVAGADVAERGDAEAGFVVAAPSQADCRDRSQCQPSSEHPFNVPVA